MTPEIYIYQPESSINHHFKNLFITYQKAKLAVYSEINLNAEVNLVKSQINIIILGLEYGVVIEKCQSQNRWEN